MNEIDKISKEELALQNKKLTKKIEEISILNKELQKRTGELEEFIAELMKEREEAEHIISRVSPQYIHSVRQKGKTKSLRYNMVTVLFADFEGFSHLQGHQNPEQFIDELDKVFFYFDSVVKSLNIEKIKSIGDTYICAGGIPAKNRTNPLEVVMAALEMRAYVKNIQDRLCGDEKKFWNIRFGIHTGAVIASASGLKKITYELRGDTVNTASRIESACEPSKIFISSMTYELVKEYFVCEYGGKMPVKFKGDIEMYFVRGFRPELSEGGKGLFPNSRFRTKFGLIQYHDLDEFVLNKLERELPGNLYYHNLKHTIDVVIGVEIIGRGENVNDDELLLLKTAALFHDSGHIYSYQDHETYSQRLAKEILPRYNYSEQQIDCICEIIASTKLPPYPTNLLQKIICDADLDYLGRRDFIPVSGELFKEYSERQIVTDLNQWNKKQLVFLESHQYYTQTANNMREVNKQKQIERLKKIITD